MTMIEKPVSHGGANCGVTVDRVTDIEDELLKRSMQAASDGDFERGLRLVDRFWRIYLSRAFRVR
jgi:hypothetical protein